MKALGDTLQAIKSSVESALVPTIGYAVQAGKIDMSHLREIAVMAMDGTATPMAVDQALQTILQSQKNLSLKIESVSLYDEKGGYMGERKTVVYCENIHELTGALDYLCKPCANEIIYREVYGMWNVMAKRAEDGSDFEAKQAIFADELRKYPQDIIIFICRNARKSWLFFPALSEIIKECDKLYNFRLSLRNAMREPTPQITKQTSYREIERKDWNPHHFLQKITDLLYFASLHQKEHHATEELADLLAIMKFVHEAEVKFQGDKGMDAILAKTTDIPDRIKNLEDRLDAA